VKVGCPCGEEFTTTEKRRAEGRGRYCSRICMYRYRVRPTGLVYNVTAQNIGWFKPGEARLSGEDHPMWKGDKVGYTELHRWVRKNRVRPSACEQCGDVGRTEWANKSHEYRRDLTDWLALCRLCHRRYDMAHRGAAVDKYGKDLGQCG
jgi:hypothetical protein